MSTENINIGESELKIMKVIWKAKQPISSSEINDAVADMGWKRTTIATFLARLVEKEILASEKRRKTLYYTPLITAGEYKKSQLKSFVKRVFDGSAHDLVVSLFEEETLSDEDITELKEIFEEKE